MRRMDQVATVPVDPARAQVYAEGWQSWSVTGIFPVTDPPPPVTWPDSLAIDCQYRRSAPEGVFQGAGVLAVDPGDGGPVTVFGAAAGLPDGVPVIQAVPRGSALVIAADAPVTELASSGPGGLPAALGRWADGFSADAGLPRVPVMPPVWCSWYQYFSDVTEGDVLANLDAMASLDLPVGIVQIDDGYEACVGDWLISSRRFSDLPGLVSRIRTAGRRAGIWIAPWLVGMSSELFAAHPDWVVRDPASGDPVWAGNVCRDDCAALDVTHPAAAAYLADVLATMRGWGIDYFKIDFCYAGAYEGLRHEAMAGVPAYRHGLGLIRDAIGAEALLVGCGAPSLASAGLVDAMRVGPDIAANYQPSQPHPSLPSQRNAARNVTARAWQHGRFWNNDPDCLMLRPGVERREDWAAVVRGYGGLRSSGDGLDQLDAWGLETTRELLVPSSPEPLS
jgi:alpha-galactosidase